MSAWFEVGVLSVALALDAAAVSASLGAAAATNRTLAAAALVFGVFQAGMSGLGAAGGAWVARYAAAWDHWIAFVLLLGVGGSMILGDSDDDPEVSDRISAKVLLVLGVATSIDALAAGVSLPLLGPPPLATIAAIGAVTTVLSVAAGLAGRRVGAHLGGHVETIGGLVLIAIGVRIVAEHLGYLG